MTTNLTKLLENATSPDLVSTLGRAVGVSDSSVSLAAGSLIPTLFAGLAQKASDGEGARGLFDMFTGANVDVNVSASIGNSLRSGETSSLGRSAVRAATEYLVASTLLILAMRWARRQARLATARRVC